jgi:iron complex transport system substrate-binding protein
MRFGCPALSGKNREAGENPARSRHCEDRRFGSDDAKARDLPGRCLQLSNASRKGVQAALGILFAEKDPVASLSLSRGRKGDGILYLQLKDKRGEGQIATPDFKANYLSSYLALTLVALAIAFTASCYKPPSQNSSTNNATREVVDEAGRRVQLPLHIDRIVSLAPNLTEIVYAVGAGDRLVGDTEYCDYPAEAKKVAKIGDTMHPSIERIIALKPQIVLVSTASQLEAFTKQLDDQEIAVYVTNPRSLDEVFRSIETLGDLLGHHEAAASIAADLRTRAASVEDMRSGKPVRVFYQVSGEPLYTIGRDAYLTDLVRRAGGVSVTADVPGAFPRFSDESALAARPEAIILPSGGSMGTANSTVAASLKNSPAALNNRVYKINDDHLSRPGPRLVDGLEEIARALHPEAFK